MPSLRSSGAPSNSPGPSRTIRTRRRLSPSHMMLGPLLNGDMMPPDEEKVNCSTWGLYFARGAAMSEQKKFPSYRRRHSHACFIEVQDDFGFDTYGDDIYKIKVIVDDHRYLVAGTYDQSSRECNVALQSYGCSEKFKGNLAIFCLSKYEPERFLETFPHFKNAEEKKDVIWRILTSRRPHNFPRVPSRSDTLNPSPNAATLPNFYTLRWVTSSLPFLGFAPSSNPFKFYFLKCLDYAFHTLPIERISENRYTLKQSLQTDYEIWRTEVDARRAVMCSRQAFIPLIACISFYLRLLYHLESKWVDIVAESLRAPFQEPSAFLSKRQQEYERLRQEPAPSKWEWQQLLQKEMSIAPEWLAYFHQIMDIPMIGTFLDVHNSGCFPWLPVFLEAKMPLMLFWGTIDNWSIPQRLTFLTPIHNTTMFPILSAATISTLVKAQKPWPPSPEENRLQEAGSSDARVRLPHITGGLPRPNEDLFAFIKRRDERRLRVISSETTLEHQSRLQREENAQRDRPPGRKGARVLSQRGDDSDETEWKLRRKRTDTDPNDKVIFIINTEK
ncbi:hypothetical protein F5050DRAFT_1813307 [Lentinula boryana]|uniref:Uncharacterized protein n=1 Tax=Lentinula boryana TaxID=40481 RepID=A0ABQ8PZM6_9AGAR|nr:hypothetical protein F5050DRAFT_1813307 [Lentinula boryana]